MAFIKTQSSRTLAVIDFETTGLSAERDRIIEVGAVIIENGKVKDTFAELVNPGFRIPGFISQLTGITNEMLLGKPMPQQIMPQLKKFLANYTILAHNASFDSRFLKAEIQRARLEINNPFLCTMMLARRIIPEAPNHRLSGLATFLNFKIGRAHRALDDVHLTVDLWNYLAQRVKTKTGHQDPDLSLFEKLVKKPKSQSERFLKEMSL